MHNFRKRQRRRALWRLGAITAAVFVAAAVVFVSLAPSREEQPLVTVYMKPDCESCMRWVDHLNARGFRTQMGTEEEWMTARAKARVPARFSSDHLAEVGGLYIEGYVPAGDIHWALSSPRRSSIRALVLSGAPPGAPGLEAALEPSYVVFAVDAHGLARPWAVHNHFTP